LIALVRKGDVDGSWQSLVYLLEVVMQLLFSVSSRNQNASQLDEV
jgi:hypothetical protein